MRKLFCWKIVCFPSVGSFLHVLLTKYISIENKVGAPKIMHIYCPIKGSLFVHYIRNWILFLHIVSHLVMYKLHSFLSRLIVYIIKTIQTKYQLKRTYIYINLFTTLNSYLIFDMIKETKLTSLFSIFCL